MTIVSGQRVLELADVKALAPGVPEEFVKLAFERYTVWPRLKAGYRAVALRCPKPSEQYIDLEGACIYTAESYEKFTTPRVIVEPLPKVKRVVFTPVLDERGEQVVRYPKKGEFYGHPSITDCLHFSYAYDDHQEEVFSIFVRSEEEV